MKWRILFFTIILAFVIAHVERQRELFFKSELLNQAYQEVNSVENNLANTPFQDSLKKYFSSLERQLLLQQEESFENIKTAQDSRQFYLKSVSLCELISKNLQKRAASNSTLPSLEWFNSTIHGIKLLANRQFATPDYLQLIERAKSTPELADEMYFSLMANSYHKEGISPAWMEKKDGKTWCSILGKGTHHKLIKQAESALAKDTPFANDIRKLRSMLLSDIAYGKSFCEGKRKILKEINLVYQEASLNEKEKGMLKTRLQHFEESKVMQVSELK